MLLQTLATSKLVDTSDINTVNTSTVISQQSSKRATHNFRTVDNTNRVTEQSISVGQDGVVDVQVLEDLNVGKGSAGQNALLALGFRVQEADVLVHVEDVLVAQTLDILADVHDLLQVLVLAVVEDGVVYDDAVDFGVFVGAEDGFFDVVAADFTEGVLESTVLY